MEITDGYDGDSWVYYNDIYGNRPAESWDRVISLEDLEEGHNHFTVDITIILKGESDLSYLNGVTSTDWFGPEFEYVSKFENRDEISYVSDSYNENVHIYMNITKWNDNILRAAICPKSGTIDASADSYYMEYTLTARVKAVTKYVNVTAVYKITVIPDPDRT